MSLRTWLCELLSCCPPETLPPVVVPVVPGSAALTVVVINQATTVQNPDVVAALAALQLQVSRDFAPVWGRDAKLRFDTSAKQGEWPIYLLDDADVPGALGYHDLNAQGVPEGKVFCRTSQSNGVTWTSVLSHELLEILADPLINSMAFVDDGSGNAGTVYNIEVGDPVEQDGYLVGSTLVSDFVYPAWFVPGEKGPYDHLNLTTKPLQLRAGGYQVFAAVHGFQQQTADKVTGAVASAPSAARPK